MILIFFLKNQGQRNQADDKVGYHPPLVAIQIKPPTACLNSSREKATTKARMIAS